MADKTLATLHTSLGDITVELLPFHAPKTVRNFAGLATGEIEWTHPRTGRTTSEPLYNGVQFHRVIRGFMIQSGDPIGTGTGGPGYRFADEIHPELVFDQPYLLAMANAGPNTNGSQFFITTAPAPWLNRKHTIFGWVVAGSDVVAAIESVATDSRDRPKQPVVISSITIAEAGS